VACGPTLPKIKTSCSIAAAGGSAFVEITRKKDNKRSP